MHKRSLSMKNEVQNSSLCYAPAWIETSFCGNSKQAVEVLNYRLNKQICLFCYEEAKSINEISNAFSTAEEFLDETLTTLTDLNILRKTGTKYITNFIMIPSYEQSRAFYESYKCCIEKNFPERIHNCLLELESEIRKLIFYGNTFDYKYLLWILYSLADNAIIEQTVSFFPRGKNATLQNENFPLSDEFPFSIRAAYRYQDDGRIFGEEFSDSESNIIAGEDKMCPQKIPLYSSNYKVIKTQDFGNIHFNNAFDAPPFKCSYNFDEDTFNEKNGRFIEPGTLSVLIKKINNPKYELTEAEKKYFVHAEESGYAFEKDGTFQCNIPVFTNDVWKKLNLLLRKAMKPFAEEIVQSCGKKVEEIILPFIRKEDDSLLDQFYSFWISSYLSTNNLLYWYGINKGGLLMPQDGTKSAAGLFIVC